MTTIAVHMTTTPQKDTLPGVVVSQEWLTARLNRAGWSLSRFCAENGFSTITRWKLNNGLPMLADTRRRVIEAAERLPELPAEALGETA